MEHMGYGATSAKPRVARKDSVDEEVVNGSYWELQNRSPSCLVTDLNKFGD